MRSKLSKVAYPDPPDGYETAVRFQYPIARLQIAAIISFIAAAILFTRVAHWLNSDIAITVSAADKFPDIIVILISLVAIVIIHEAVHGLTYRLMGYRVSYGLSWQMGAAYAAAFAQWQKRNHNLIAAVAPLLVLTPLLITLLAFPHHKLNLAAYVALIFNTGGAAGDLYLAWRLLKMPPKALLYDLNPQIMLIYLPN